MRIYCLAHALFCVLFAISDLTDAETCDFSRIPLQQNFNMKRFLGNWFEEERTELQWGQNTWHSAVWNLFEAASGTSYFSYTGHSESKGCSSPETGFFTDTSLNGRVTLTSEKGQYELTFQVAYTDYQHVALVYMCYEPLVNGVCHKGKMHLSLLSRHSPLTSQQRSTLISHLGNTCLVEADIIKALTGLCVAPTPDPVLVGR
ncbi:uncharacterized protein LOC123534951 [Mercenaria mercenaria]|uniref:uncharacterized protein LOC123534951 n=1 Tax=Mercenaria mercenaria TaxID=6596 RepID=UPI00234F98F7|nr:uncharacterized protein LOC123534951 [Mercenaria mercenaria]